MITIYDPLIYSLKKIMKQHILSYALFLYYDTSSVGFDICFLGFLSKVFY